jgi:Sir2- and TIR-associating SLOG family
LSQAGLAIFVMGNKVSGSSIVDADGVRQEFEIAKRENLKLIPIGASGFVAERLGGEVMADFDRNSSTLHRQ